MTKHPDKMEQNKEDDQIILEMLKAAGIKFQPYQLSFLRQVACVSQAAMLVRPSRCNMIAYSYREELDLMARRRINITYADSDVIETGGRITFYDEYARYAASWFDDRCYQPVVKEPKHIQNLKRWGRHKYALGLLNNEGIPEILISPYLAHLPNRLKVRKQMPACSGRRHDRYNRKYRNR